jgi:hypothetical protein
MSSNEPEWLTRKTRIDGRLRALGWEVVPHTPFFRPEKAHAKAVAEYPTENGPAVYALFVHGRILGIIEAKKLSLGPQNVLVQAERYERGSVMLSSNLAFSGWEAIFKDAMMTAAAIDRLVHHCVILELNVPSYRAEQAKKGRQTPDATK